MIGTLIATLMALIYVSAMGKLLGKALVPLSNLERLEVCFAIGIPTTVALVIYITTIGN